MQYTKGSIIYFEGDHDERIAELSPVKTGDRVEIQEQTAEMQRDPVGAVPGHDPHDLLRDLQKKQQRRADLQRQKLRLIALVSQNTAQKKGERDVNGELGQQRVCVQRRPEHE